MFVEVGYGETNCSSLPCGRFKREGLMNMEIGTNFVTNACMNFQWLSKVSQKEDYNKNLQVIQSNIQALLLSIRRLVILSGTLQFDTQLF
jgi:hypothetical protein